ncbi:MULTISPECIES: glycosyltransferase family 2 protein [Bradyrhizobium]|uniref:Glycosyltransferase n=1 Tax=Bradyrhizobium vignae TaxID=1549949 RepID=A0ABS4A2A5_9BRAD|nr:glycosyltransferase [Bradyrhizobium vignae]MBP0114548.1 glycosyltransferase [Bradyrhizobium vignae]
MAKVDVLVPCYNYGRFLTDCVKSVLTQSIQDVRVLIIDDASSDDTVEVATRLKAADARVEFMQHARNRGHIRTYNEGIEWASGEYFLLLSADDLLVPHALERATSVMDRNPDIVLTFGECATWRECSPFPEVWPMRDYSWTRFNLLNEMCTFAANLVPTPTAIVRTNVQKTIGGYREALPHSGDMEMWLRFAANGAVARIDAVQAIYRKHETAMSNSYCAEMLFDYRQRYLAFESFFIEYGPRLKGSGELKLLAQRKLARKLFRDGVGLLRRGQLSRGLRYLREWTELNPRASSFWPVPARNVANSLHPSSRTTEEG